MPETNDSNPADTDLPNPVIIECEGLEGWYDENGLRIDEDTDLQTGPTVMDIQALTLAPYKDRQRTCGILTMYESLLRQGISDDDAAKQEEIKTAFDEVRQTVRSRTQASKDPDDDGNQAKLAADKATGWALLQRLYKYTPEDAPQDAGTGSESDSSEEGEGQNLNVTSVQRELILDMYSWVKSELDPEASFHLADVFESYDS